MGVLTSSDIAKRYAQVFSIVEIDFAYRRSAVDEAAARRPEVVRYNPKQFRPVIVILNADGKQVFKSFGGFNNPREAAILAEFIDGSNYRTVGWKEYFAEKYR